MFEEFIIIKTNSKNFHHVILRDLFSKAGGIAVNKV